MIDYQYLIKVLWFTLAVVWIFIAINIIFNTCCKADNEKTLLAICIRAECNKLCSQKEKLAIIYVLEKRMNQYNKNKYNIKNNRYRTFVEQILLYCAVFKKKNREAYIRKSIYEINEWWIETWKVIYLYYAGKTIDPYPNAYHWGCKKCRIDNLRAKRSGMKVVVSLENIYYTNERIYNE